LFVAAEFAVVAVDRSRIEALAQDGHRRAISTLKALRTLSFQLSGAQLGITVTSLLVGFVIEPTVGEALEPLVAKLDFVPEESSLAVSVALALGLATAVQMILGELVPKNLAIARPLGVSFAVVTPFRLINALFRPVILFLNESANWTVKRLGIEPQEELISVRSLEELELLIRSSREHGALPEEKFSLLARSISFAEKTAADALVPRVAVTGVSKDATLQELAETALDSGHSRFPVYGKDLDDIAGIVHAKDIYATPPEERSHKVVGEIMREALVLPESRALDELLLDLRRDRQQMAVVVDEFGGTAGIVTLEDIIEEIVGEIEDEHDVDSALTATATPAGVHVVSALLHPDEVRDVTGFDMPEGDYETLAGFLLSRFDRIPQTGDHISFQGWEFKVVDMDRNRISQVLMVAPPPPAEETEA
jgi:CBS domain containing-hemolysin-like protein